MEVSQGLDRFQLGQERPEDSQATLKRIWRQIMAETNQHRRAAREEIPETKKRRLPEGKRRWFDHDT